MSVKTCPNCSDPIEESWIACPHCGVKITSAGAEPGGHDTLRTIAREEIEKTLKEREEKKPPGPVAANADSDFIDDLLERIS